MSCKKNFPTLRTGRIFGAQSPLPILLAASPFLAAPPPELYFSCAYTIPPASQTKISPKITCTLPVSHIKQIFHWQRLFRQIAGCWPSFFGALVDHKLGVKASIFVMNCVKREQVKREQIIFLLNIIRRRQRSGKRHLV